MNLKIDWPNRGHEYSQEDLEIVEKIIYDNNTSLSKGNMSRCLKINFPS